MLHCLFVRPRASAALVLGAVALTLVPGAAAAAEQEPIAAPPYRAPYLPRSDDEVLQQVPDAANPHVRQVAALRARLTQEPGDWQLADELVRAYIDFARAAGDAHYAGYAEAVLSPWLGRPSPPVAALVDYATILQYRHQFSAARAQLETALGRDSRDAQAWLTLATVDMVQGRYDAVPGECAHVGASGALEPGIACIANLRSYRGQARQSLLLLRQLENAPHAPPTFDAWIEGLLAETCERLGDWPQVEAHYRRALSYAPDDNFLQVSYADFLLDQHRPAEVLKLLAASSQSDTAFLRLTLAKAALHQPDAPLYGWIMAARFEALRQRGADYFGREQVRFALDIQHDAAGALDLAQRNWQLQRAPWDARVFLEAALAAHDPRAAGPVIAFLRRTRLEDPIIGGLVAELQAQARPAPPPPKKPA